MVVLIPLKVRWLALGYAARIRPKKEILIVFHKKGSWALVADGRKALFLRNNGDTKDYDLRVVWHRTMDNPANHEQGSGRPDRANPGPVGRRSAIEPTDWHQIAEDRFAKEVAGILGKAHTDGAFEEVAIAAPPAVLSELRDHLSANVAGAVIAEIAKTLTYHPIDTIEMILKADLDAL